MAKITQHDAILQKISEQDIRWLRKHFFILADREDVYINKLIDTSERGAYLKEIFERMANESPEKVQKLSKTLTVSFIRGKVSLLNFAQEIDDEFVTIKNKVKEANRDIVREIACLSLGFKEFDVEMNKIEKDKETAVVYLSADTNCADEIKIKLSYIIGYLCKENVVIFCKNCENSNDIQEFIHETRAICECVNILCL